MTRPLPCVTFAALDRDIQVVSESTARTARSILINWANSKDKWVIAIVAEVLSTRARLDRDALLLVRDRFYAEKRLSSEQPTAVSKLTDSVRSAESNSSFVLTKLSNCIDVNRLASDQEIIFGSRLTVLFGENASGKTGYVRIFKRLSGVRGAGRVLPDIEKPTSGSPSAKFEYILDGVESKLSWSNEAGVRPFDRITVFDSPAVSIHLDESLEYVFTPADLSLFGLVHEAVSSVRQVVLDDISHRRPNPSQFLALFSPGTTAYALVGSLGPASSVDDLDRAAKVTEEDREKIRQLLVRIDSLKPETEKAALKLLQNRRKTTELLLELVGTVAPIDLDAQRMRFQALTAAEQARSETARQIGDHDTVNEQWQRFLVAAEAYILATQQSSYPAQGGKCVLCRQELTAGAVELIQRYRTFASGSEAALIADLGRQLSTGFDAVRRAETSRARAALDALGDDGLTSPETDLAARNLLAQLDSARSAGERSEQTALALAVELAAEIGPKISQLKAQLDDDIGSATASNVEREEALRIAEAELDERKDQTVLAEHLGVIKKFVEDEKWCSQADEHIKKFQGVLRTLTDASKEASQQALQHNFEERFEEEREALRAPRVRINFPGRQGKTVRSKSVSSQHGLEDILSEGEQKVIALADFLAEGLLRAGSAPIVFDDPVNSLDYRRLSEVVARIGTLSRERQVIVFTHNIWFAAELLSHFEKDKDSYRYYDIESTGSEKGIINNAIGPRTDLIKQTKREIEEIIAAADSLSSSAQRAMIERGYEYLRNFCEMFVEHELLGGVTERYSAHVGVTRVGGLKFDRMQGAGSVIVKIYEKCCREIRSHSQPLETLNSRATLDDLRTDWQAAWDCRSNFVK